MDGTIAVWNLDPEFLSSSTIKSNHNDDVETINNTRKATAIQLIGKRTTENVPVHLNPNYISSVNQQAIIESHLDSDSDSGDDDDCIPLPLPLPLPLPMPLPLPLNLKIPQPLPPAQLFPLSSPLGIHILSDKYHKSPMYLPCPFIRLVDHHVDSSTAPRSSVRSASFCPYNPNLIMTAGYDSAVKVYGLEGACLSVCMYECMYVFIFVYL